MFAVPRKSTSQICVGVAMVGVKPAVETITSTVPIAFAARARLSTDLYFATSTLCIVTSWPSLMRLWAAVESLPSLRPAMSSFRPWAMRLVARPMPPKPMTTTMFGGEESMVVIVKSR
jgi:hypothetical protein